MLRLSSSFYWHTDVVRAFIELLHRLRKIDFRYDVRSHVSEKTSHSRSATNQCGPDLEYNNTSIYLRWSRRVLHLSPTHSKRRKRRCLPRTNPISTNGFSKWSTKHELITSLSIFFFCIEKDLTFCSMDLDRK